VFELIFASFSSLEYSSCVLSTSWKGGGHSAWHEHITPIRDLPCTYLSSAVARDVEMSQSSISVFLSRSAQFEPRPVIKLCVAAAKDSMG